MLLRINICSLVTPGSLLAARASLYSAAQNSNSWGVGMGGFPWSQTYQQWSYKDDIGLLCHEAEERLDMLLCAPENLCLDAGGWGLGRALGYCCKNNLIQHATVCLAEISYDLGL